MIAAICSLAFLISVSPNARSQDLLVVTRFSDGSQLTLNRGRNSTLELRDASGKPLVDFEYQPSAVPISGPLDDLVRQELQRIRAAPYPIPSDHPFFLVSIKGGRGTLLVMRTPAPHVKPVELGDETQLIAALTLKDGPALVAQIRQGIHLIHSSGREIYLGRDLPDFAALVALLPSESFNSIETQFERREISSDLREINEGPLARLEALALKRLAKQGAPAESLHQAAVHYRLTPEELYSLDAYLRGIPSVDALNNLRVELLAVHDSIARIHTPAHLKGSPVSQVLRLFSQDRSKIRCKGLQSSE